MLILQRVLIDQTQTTESVPTNLHTTFPSTNPQKRGYKGTGQAELKLYNITKKQEKKKDSHNESEALYRDPEVCLLFSFPSEKEEKFIGNSL